MRSTILSFFKALFINPRSIGAIIPSSHYLAESMSRCITKSESGFILELGPGTGAITTGILKSGISPNQLVALEISQQLAEQFKKNFPEITVIHGDATQLSKYMGNKKFDTIISSLPLRSLSKTDLDKILMEIPRVLSPHGKFIQFTYAIFGREKFLPKNYQLEKSFIEWRNIPPARVDVFVIDQCNNNSISCARSGREK